MASSNENEVFNVSDEETEETDKASTSKQFGSSVVYRFFEVILPAKTDAKCVLCKTIVKRIYGSNATTGTMWNHLRLYHPKQHGEIKTKPNVTKTTTQPTIFHCLDKMAKWKINDERAKKLHYKIGEMIVLDNQPFSLVSDFGFRQLLEAAQPRYEVPSRHYITSTIIPDIYNRCRTVILDHVKQSSWISFTTDIWTATTTNDSFISFTAHFLTENFCRCHYVLNVKAFPESHNAENIAAIIKDMMEMWSIGTEKVHLVLRDNAANMVKGIPLAGLTGAPCFIHTLQLVIRDALDVQRAVNDAIALCRKIVGHFNHSSNACHKLKEIQEIVKDPQHKLIQDVQTRWNSTYYMLERILEQKESLVYFSAKYSAFTILSSAQWDLIKNLLTLLKPFEEITKIVSKSESVISEVIPFTETLKHVLEQENPNHFGLGTMKDTMKNSLSARFTSISTCKHYVVATFIDPRFKLDFFPGDKIGEIEEIVKAEYQLIAPTFVEEPPTDQVTHRAPIIPGAVQEKSIVTSFSAAFENRRQRSISVQEDALVPERLAGDGNAELSKEIQIYRSFAVIQRSENPFDWWNSKYSVLPKLSLVARKYLSAPASSVYSEQLFSEAGNIYEDHRSRMLPENGEMLAFAHHNLPLLKYKY